MKPLLLVTTLLSGEGPTGVETHFNQVMRDLRERGAVTKLISPYTGLRLRRAIFRPLKNLKNERAAMLYRRCQAKVLEEQIRAALAENPDQAVTVYAQCPLSARAALAARGHRAARLLLVVHYNVAESDEVVNKSLARPGGPWATELAKVERETLPQLDGVVFPSDFMRRTVNERIPAMDRVFQETIFNFAPSAFERGEHANKPRDLVAIGTLEPRKNQAFLLHVLAAARTLGRCYTLTLVGDGPDRGRLERLTDSLNLREQVLFAGFRPDAARLIPEHRALVHAAKLENCPLIIPEALAAGRPIFAAAVGGIPELFRHGIEGYFWNLENPVSAAHLLVELLENPARYASASDAARARYDSVFAGLRERWIKFLMPSLATVSAPEHRVASAQP